MFDGLIILLEMIGVVAFAVSGAITAIEKEMDIYGVTVLGFTTAVGGGVLRDVLLGTTPPMMFRDPKYALVAVIVSIAVFVPSVRRIIMRDKKIYDRIMLISDSIGLGVFTVAGIQTAYAACSELNVFLFVFVGVLTGVGGGVMRDLFSQSRPYIFVKHFYACASMIGAIVCVFLWDIAGNAAAMLAGAVCIVALRLAAAHFRWKLPKA